jgi:hypothetical protein
MTPWNFFYTEFYLDFFKGSLKYDGVYSAYPYNPYVGKLSHFFLNARVKVGPVFTITDSDSLQAIPYVGMGYHYWNRQDNTKDPEKYHHSKAIVGMKLNCLLTDLFVLSPYVEGGKIFYARAKRGTNLYRLGKNPIYEAGLELNYKIAIDLFLNGFVSYSQFKYGRSADASDGSWEPDSKTREIKVGIGVRWLND